MDKMQLSSTSTRNIYYFQLGLISAAGRNSFANYFDVPWRIATPRTFYRAGCWVLNAPFHFAAISMGILLVGDKHGRGRMGSQGVLHMLMNVASLVSFYFLGNGYDGPPRPWALAVHAVSSTLGTVSALGLMWMILAASKRHSRIFACAYAACFSIAWTQVLNLLHAWDLEDSFIWAVARVVYGTILVPGTIVCLLNYIDVWCSIVLRQFQRRFKNASSAAKLCSTPRKQSSAYTHPAAERTFWRAFRKADYLKHMFPLRDEGGQLRCSSAFDMDSMNVSVHANIVWVIYSIGETGTVLILLKDFVMDHERKNPPEFGVL